MDDEPSHKQFILEDNTSDWCKRCGDENNTISHFEKCERDNEMLEKAKKWIEYMDKQDRIIDEYLQLQDQCIDVPKTYIRDRMN